MTYRNHAHSHREESEKRTTKSTSHQHRTLPQDEKEDITVILASTVPLTLLNLLAIRSISTDCGSSESFSRTHQIVPLGSASRCPDLVVVLAVRSAPVFDESLTPTDVPSPHLKTRLATAILIQRFMDRTFLLWSCANRLHSLSAALSLFARCS